MFHHSEIIARVIQKLPPTIGVEIGVQTGKTSRTLLSRFHGLTLHMIDPWNVMPPDGSYSGKFDPEWLEQAYVKTVKTVNGFGNRARIFRGTSAEAAPMFNDGSLDFGFIDGDHAYEGVKQDAALWWPKIRTGGILLFHDYDNQAAWTRGVKPAVDESAEAFDRELHVESNTIAWMRK